MFKRKNFVSQRYFLLAVLVAATGATSSAVSGELDELQRYANYDVQAEAKLWASSESLAAAEDVAAHRNASKYDLEDLSWSESDLDVVNFARECAEIDAIPLMKLSSTANKRVFLGINFDGVFGFHGQLL